MAATTINDLKRYLGASIGLRKNKYLIEIPVNASYSKNINILCRSASFPERKLSPVKISHMGRPFYLRGETDFGNTYSITVLDDSMMTMRRLFDDWLTQTDNTKVATQSNNSPQGIIQSSIQAYKDVTADLARVRTVNPNQKNKNGYPFYQIDINVWQLDQTGDKVHGYKLQNAFPIELGTVTFSDVDDDSSLTEFNVTFQFSEFEVLTNPNIVNVIAGELNELKNTVTELTDFKGMKEDMKDRSDKYKSKFKDMNEEFKQNVNKDNLKI